MPQNEYIERHIKLHGRRFDHETKTRKKAARAPGALSKKAQTLRGIKSKIFKRERYAEKVQLRKRVKHHEEKEATEEAVQKTDGAIPAYLLDRGDVNRTKVGAATDADPEQHDQAETQGEGREVGSPDPQGTRSNTHRSAR